MRGMKPVTVGMILVLLLGCDKTADAPAKTKAEPSKAEPAKTEPAPAKVADAKTPSPAKTVTPPPAPTPPPTPAAPQPPAPPTPGTTTLDNADMRGPYADLTKLCADTQAITGNEPKCSARGKKPIALAAPFVAGTMLEAKVTDEDGDCILAIQVAKGWYATGWACSDPMVGEKTELVGIVLEDVISGGSQEAAVTLQHEGHLDEGGAPYRTQQLRVCVARDDAAPVCTVAVEIGGVVTPEGGSEQTWKTRRTATSDGFEIVADGTIPDVHKDVVQRYVVELD